MVDHYKTKRDSYSIVQDYSETEGHELCKAGLKFKYFTKEKEDDETSFKLRTHFEGSQSLTEVWSVQTLILINDASKLGKLT